MIAPALAACGAFVPMISGRGLGHTGGTLDKFDAIPGYQTEPDISVFRKTVAEVGCAVVGPTADIAPADARLYAIRDVTATVESIDLICASILSKKLAAGLDGLVIDVKLGNGAFMDKTSRAEKLARVLVDVASGAGCPTTALITDMNEPLMPSAGNALEMAAAIGLLTGQEVDGRVWDVICHLGGAVLFSAGLQPTPDAARSAISEALSSGKAAETFGRMTSALGGPSNLLEAPADHLAHAPVVHEVTANQTGFVQDIDTRGLGDVVVGLGGGRLRGGDTIDLSVGLQHIAGRGLIVEHDTPLALVHARTPEAAEVADAAVRAAFSIGETPPDVPDLIQAVIS